MMWFAKDLTIKKNTNSIDPITGEKTTTATDILVKGYIVPTTSEDILNGYEVGSYKVFLETITDITAGIDTLYDNSTGWTYQIKRKMVFPDKNITILEVIK